MDCAKAKVDGRLMEVVDPSYYLENQSIYTTGSIAVRKKIDGKEYVLPIRNQTDLRPGMVTNGSNCALFTRSCECISDQYLSDNVLVNFSDAKTMQEIVEKQNQCRSYEYEMLCDPDNIYRPPIQPSDSPAMKGLKEAMAAKNFDIDKYKGRFGPNYPNYKRLMNKGDITLKMLDVIASTTDIEVTMTFRDRGKDIPNPMGREITVTITGGEDSGGEDGN